jgi:hypothetical protein
VQQGVEAEPKSEEATHLRHVSRQSRGRWSWSAERLNGSRAGYLEAHGEHFIPLTYNSILIIDKQQHGSKFFLCREILSSEGCHTTFMWGKEYVNVTKLCARFEDDGRLMSV